MHRRQNWGRNLFSRFYFSRTFCVITSDKKKKMGERKTYNVTVSGL